MRTRAVMLNGFVFDELAPEVVTSLATSSHTSGASIFFDPGGPPLLPLLRSALGTYMSQACHACSV